MPAANEVQQKAGAVASRANRTLWLLFVLPLIGLGLAAYLWRAKTGAVELVCTALGDCLTVNMSVYADIAGIPVAAAGAGMYAVLVMLGGLVMLRQRTPRWVFSAGFMIALAGAIFSLYLTGIEAFVLRAYCMWCLTSWVLVTVLALLWGRLYRLHVHGDQPARG